MSFGCASKNDWCLSPRVSKERQEKLLKNVGYKKILDKLTDGAQATYRIRDKRFRRKKFYRIEVLIKCNIGAVDLFHNSRCGYRAQYYQSIERGKKANYCALKIFWDLIKDSIHDDDRFLAEKSMFRKDSKIWIYQGSWIRPFKCGGQKKHRNLNVKRWLEKETSSNDEEKELSRLSKLTPRENRLTIKGGWIDKDGKPISTELNPKPTKKRNFQLKRLGFT